MLKYLRPEKGHRTKVINPFFCLEVSYKGLSPFVLTGLLETWLVANFLLGTMAFKASGLIDENVEMLMVSKKGRKL